MKKALIMTAVALLAVAGAYLAFAAEQTGSMMGGGMMGGGMRGRGKMDSNDMTTRQGMMGGGMMGGGMRGRGMQGRGTMDSNDMMMQRRMPGGYGMYPMSGMMYNSSMVLTQDGGVIVLMGNKLLKYDSSLNLVKEVEIKIDWENWRNTMMQQRRMMMGAQSQ